MVADKEFYYSIYHGKLPQTDVEGCLSRACLLYTSRCV